MKSNLNMIDKIKQRVEPGETVRAIEMASPGLLSYGESCDSARMVMFDQHIQQRVVLNNTEFPRVFTNYENIVGDNSSYNHRAKGDLELIKIIHKFKNVPESFDIQTALFFVYDRKNARYDVIVRKDAEDLTEKYGFQNDNSGINQYKEGDVIPEGATLFRPTSFDEFGNYGFGVNVPVMFLACNETIEDGVKVSETLGKIMMSTEVEHCKVPINDNDILVDLYGETTEQGQTYYRGFPNIGERVKDRVICATRRLTNNRILFDLKTSNTKKVMNSDISYYIDGEAYVYDIDIYCNKDIDKIAKTSFNQQLLEYLYAQREFAREVRDFTRELIDSGIPCSMMIRSWNRDMTEYLDPNFKIRDESNSEFSNIVMIFHVKRPSGISRGQKITGRYGNKGVATEIVPDKLMPITENGKRIHAILNVLGPYNRLIIMPLREQSINFILDRVLDYFKENDLSLTQREDIFFDILGSFSKEYSDVIEKHYREDYKSKTQKEEFFQRCNQWVGVNIKPFWHEENIYEELVKIYKRYPWIQPYKVYFWEPSSKRYVKMMNDIVVSDMYLMKLKQSSKKNLSVCSYAPVSQIGLPEKTDTAKKHKTLIPPTPIKFGRQEIANVLISIKKQTYAKLHTLYRTSPIARQTLGSTIIDNYGKNLPIDVEINEYMNSRAVEILKARLLPMGLDIVFENDELDLPQVFGQEYNKNEVRYHKYDGTTYIATPDYMLSEFVKNEARNRVDEKEIGYIYIGNEGAIKEEFINEIAQEIYNEIMSMEKDEWFQRRNDEVIE